MDKSIAKSPSQWRFILTRGTAARLAICVIGFFVGRIVVFDMINPVAIGFLGSLAGTGFSFYAASIFLIMGIATRLNDAYIARYLVSVGLLCIANIAAHKFLLTNKITVFAQGAACALCIFVGSLSVTLIYGAGILTLIGLFEAVLAFFLTFVLCKASLVLTAPKLKSWLSNEEVISLAILSGCIIAGASDIYIGVVSLRYFLCIYFLFSHGARNRKSAQKPSKPFEHWDSSRVHPRQNPVTHRQQV